MLLKMALLLGIEIHVNVEFKGLVEPPEDQDAESKRASGRSRRESSQRASRRQSCLPGPPLARSAGPPAHSCPITCAACLAGIGWRAEVHPRTHPVNELEFDVIIGADGRRNTLPGKPAFFFLVFSSSCPEQTRNHGRTMTSLVRGSCGLSVTCERATVRVGEERAALTRSKTTCRGIGSVELVVCFPV